LIQTRGAVAPTRFDYAGDVDIAGIEAAAAFVAAAEGAGLRGHGNVRWKTAGDAEPPGEGLTASASRSHYGWTPRNG
jgi:hypothetical protein